MIKAALTAVLAMVVVGCAGPGAVGRTSNQEVREGVGYNRPAEPNFPTGVADIGVPKNVPGAIN